MQVDKIIPIEGDNKKMLMPFIKNIMKSTVFFNAT